MTARRGVPAGRRPELSWAVLALLLGGIFAMHGLATHGGHTAGSTYSGSSATSQTFAGGSVTDHPPHPDPATVGTTVTLNSDAEYGPALGGPSQGGDSLVELCLAVLTAGTLLLLLLLASHHRPKPLRLRRGTSGPGRLIRVEADPKPLSRSQLSIWRC